MQGQGYNSPIQNPQSRSVTFNPEPFLDIQGAKDRIVIDATNNIDRRNFNTHQRPNLNNNPLFQNGNNMANDQTKQQPQSIIHIHQPNIYIGHFNPFEQLGPKNFNNQPHPAPTPQKRELDNLYNKFLLEQKFKKDPYFYRNMKFDQAKINDYQSNHRQNIQVPEHVLYSQFKMYAKDGGVIDVENFLKLIDDICKYENRQRPEYYHCLYLMGKYDTNRDGSIDFEEFKNMIHQL